MRWRSCCSQLRRSGEGEQERQVNSKLAEKVRVLAYDRKWSVMVIPAYGKWYVFYKSPSLRMWTYKIVPKLERAIQMAKKKRDTKH